MQTLFATLAVRASTHDEQLLRAQYDRFVESLDREGIAREYSGAIRKLDSLDPQTLIAGLKTLGATEEVGAIPWIVPFVDSHDRRIRVVAGQALLRTVVSNELKRRDATQPGKVVIRRPAPGDHDLRPMAWVVLRMLRTGDANVRSYAATMIGYLGLSQFRGELRELLVSIHPAEAKAAGTALDMLPVDERDGPKVMTGAIDDGLAYYWSFDNQNALDSVREVNGQIVGEVRFEDGIIGKAPVIKDDSTKIVIQSPSLDLNGWNQVTFSMWGKMNGYSTYGRAISWAEGNQACGLALHVGGDSGYWVAGAFYVFLEDGGYLHVRPKAFIKNVKPYPKTGVWYHLVGTYDGKRVRFYVNGKLDGERLADTPGLRIRDLPDARLVIGRAAPSPKYDHWHDTYFPGLIDEVKIWRRALSQEEVTSLYEQTLYKSDIAAPTLSLLTEEQFITLAQGYALRSDKCKKFREEISQHFTSRADGRTSRVVADLTSHTVTFTRNLIPQDGPVFTVTVLMKADGSLLDLDMQVQAPNTVPAWAPVQ